MRLLIVIALLVNTIETKCVMRSKCGEGPLPCVVEGNYSTPQQLNSSNSYKLLRKYCIDFKDDSEDLCCDDTQVNSLSTQLNQLSAFAGKCPSCLYNIARIFCQMSCSPDQDSFLNISGSKDAEKKSPVGHRMVSSLDFYLEEDYIDRAYASCVEVQNPQIGSLIGVMCGGYGTLNCNPRNLLKAIGTAPFPSPFAMNFKYSVEGTNFKLLNHNSTKCNEVPFNGSAACSCLDCSDVCPVFPLPQEEHATCIVGIDVFIFSAVLVFTVLSSALCSAWLYKVIRGHGNISISNENLIVESDTEERMNSSILRVIFEHIGIFCANRPLTIVIVGSLVCIACSLGNLMFQVDTDPVKLWSAPNNQARLQRNYYNKHLGPFYRVEQVIIVNKGGEIFNYTSDKTSMVYEYSAIFDFDFLKEVFILQDRITNVTATFNGSEVTLQDICFSPLDQKCAIQSVPNWFQSNLTILEQLNTTYLDHINDCINSPTLTAQQDENSNIGCLGAYGGPSLSYVALGGYSGDDARKAPALILTFLVNNDREEENNARAIAWERSFIDFMKKYHHPNMTVAFMSESSINDELNRESQSDIPVILLSYFLMFIYISVALGRYKTFPTVLIHSQIALGAGGVILVFVSVVTSIGICSYAGLPSTLIIFEVIPFLVLAVGVDNMFILVQAVQRTPSLDGESVEEHIGRVLGTVGPSMLMASTAECCCFFLGTLIRMPAVRTFALYAGLALLVDFLLQISVFVALLSLDMRRQEENRLDVICCVPYSSPSEEEFAESMLQNFMKNIYAPLLRKEWYRKVVLLVFLGWLSVSVAFVNKLEVGLDQELSVPQDSYLQQYFQYIKVYLNVGPPVFFVVKDKYNYTNYENQNLLGSFIGSSEYSLVIDVKQASRVSNVTFIASPPMSWIDDFFAWSISCCLENPVTHQRCFEYNDDCKPCPTNNRGRPNSTTEHIRDFLKEIPNKDCPVAGHAAYSNAVEVVGNGSETKIKATSFMAYHSVLKNNSAFINALKMGRYVAAQIEKNIKQNYEGPAEEVEVFPYSIFYVFYEQYLTIWKDVVIQLGLSFGAVTVITFLFMKFQVVPSLSICVTILMISVDLLGFMYFANVSLNAVSLVNLVICVGISVEFCAHIARSFAESCRNSPIERAISAVSNTGSSVLSGITLTKFIGVVVLAFAKSQLFVVFYFRMYLAIVIVGSVHGLIFLPVLLATFGKSKA